MDIYKFSDIVGKDWDLKRIKKETKGLIPFVFEDGKWIKKEKLSQYDYDKKNAIWATKEDVDDLQKKYDELERIKKEYYDKVKSLK